MKIDDLKETAALAHLNLGEEELAAAFPAFEQMLGYFAAMQAADKDEGLFPSAAKLPAGQNAGARLVESGFFRADNPREVPPTGSADNPNNLNENLLNNSGDRDGRFVVIPNVL
jgi:aspartyl-tRNA(Asn)/glutamyl-tRNA(Gln) amidotransferase subunit C